MGWVTNQSSVPGLPLPPDGSPGSSAQELRREVLSCEGPGPGEGAHVSAGREARAGVRSGGDGPQSIGEGRAPGEDACARQGGGGTTAPSCVRGLARVSALLPPLDGDRSSDR